ncbi:hypothetical protein MCUN1_003483 [Malassezia cuniculi]|uniref:Small ribosomal subunit protein uS10 domain-containing protein n=1 Tax=Malassezia cuniculi TaxID=948313 RepID=A0AAF0J808_9BASI|nr:hypothetical protein MCUN1_003483 [Malassezia cuniculi]
MMLLSRALLGRGAGAGVGVGVSAARQLSVLAPLRAQQSAGAQSGNAPATTTSSASPAEVDEIDIESLVPPVAAVPKTHGVHVATLHLRAYGTNKFELEFFSDFANRAAHALKIPTGGISSFPIRTSLWTVPRGPFVHKKSQENFWRRTHHKVIKVYDANDAVVDRWLHFLRIHEMPGIASKVELFRSYPLGVGAHMAGADEGAEAADPSHKDEIRRIADEFVRQHSAA